MVQSAAAAFLLALLPVSGLAQSSGVLTIAPPSKVTVKRDETAAAKLAVQLQNGFHVNSDTPSDAYLIPLRLTWDASELQVVDTTYPKPKMETYEFTSKPLSVFTGDFDIVTRFKAPPKAKTGTAVLLGKLRYQACNEKMCLPPKTVEVRLPVDIR
jgi:thioredoxin:protein disulfide reductase